ncbi:MAG: VWA domain-containing protein [Gammaproteobacteria bacterium]|nr:VWA domain-containing protein [Gammaproteobacteria bacterium]MBU1415780.1 VWA domain-containing protein [Gammaproteobacteria bacterium]
MTDRRLFEHELEERLDRVLFASPSHRSITRLAQSLETLSRRQQDKVLHWAGVAAKTYAEIGYLLATLAPQAFELLDDDGFDAWVIAGLDAYDRQGLRPAMELLRDLEGFRAEREGRALARYADVEARLTRFVHGLSGRPLALRNVGSGNPAWTDTEILFLPDLLAERSSAEDNRRLFKATAALLWAQTRYGTFSVDIDAAIADLPDRPQALAWLTLLEAVRLDARIAQELPGLAREMAELRGPWPDGLAPALPRLQAATATVQDSLALLREFVAAGGVPPRLTFLGTLDPTAARRVRAERIAKETKVLRNALAALKGAGGRKQGGEAVLDIAPGEDGAMEIRVDGDVVALPPEAQAAAQALVQDLGELPPEALSPAGSGGWLPTDLAGPGTDLVNDRDADFRYDEWDYHRSAYRKGWCHVYEVEVKPGDADYVEEVGNRHRALISQIRRRFEAVRGEDRVLGRQPEGEEIDLDAQVDAHIDRRSGIEPSPRLFCRRIRNERSMAAMFMVDMSGSTKGWVNDAERESLIMLCEALEALGDDYAIYGFSGWTRTRCDIYRIKAFGDRYDDAVKRRIAGIEARDYTRMGVAIRHLTRLLAAQPVRHKLLVTLSDGRPDDFGDEYRGTYGIEDTRQALHEARRQGIRSYCVTIDRHGADYLKRMVGPAAYTVLDEVGKLPTKIADIYRRLTAN